MFIDSFLVKGTGILAKFWEDTVTKAARYKRNPVLIAKQNNFPTIVVTSPGGMAVFKHPLLSKYVKGKTPIMTFEVYLLSDILSVPFRSDQNWAPRKRPKKGAKRLKLIRRG